MKRDFDFDKMGKRMPYTVPDGFFTDMENDIRMKIGESAAKNARKDRTLMRIAATALTAAAAAIGLLLILGGEFHAVYPTSFAEVERAFGNLTAEEQTYLFSIYQDDIFINE